MATDNKSIKIPAPLESATTGGYVTTTGQIKEGEKTQFQINLETEENIEDFKSTVNSEVNDLNNTLSVETQARASKDANLENLINAGIRQGEGLVFDTKPKYSSANPVSSGGLYETRRKLLEDIAARQDVTATAWPEYATGNVLTGLKIDTSSGEIITQSSNGSRYYLAILRFKKGTIIHTTSGVVSTFRENTGVLRTTGTPFGFLRALPTREEGQTWADVLVGLQLEYWETPQCSYGTDLDVMIEMPYDGYLVRHYYNWIGESLYNEDGSSAGTGSRWDSSKTSIQIYEPIAGSIPIDNLTMEEPGKALDARQGFVLAERIDDMSESNAEIAKQIQVETLSDLNSYTGYGRYGYIINGVEPNDNEWFDDVTVEAASSYSNPSRYFIGYERKFLSKGTIIHYTRTTTGTPYRIGFGFTTINPEEYYNEYGTFEGMVIERVCVRIEQIHDWTFTMPFDGYFMYSSYTYNNNWATPSSVVLYLANYIKTKVAELEAHQIEIEENSMDALVEDCSDMVYWTKGASTTTNTGTTITPSSGKAEEGGSIIIDVASTKSGWRFGMYLGSLPIGKYMIEFDLTSGSLEGGTGYYNAQTTQSENIITHEYGTHCILHVEKNNATLNYYHFATQTVGADIYTIENFTVIRTTKDISDRLSCLEESAQDTANILKGLIQSGAIVAKHETIVPAVSETYQAMFRTSVSKNFAQSGDYLNRLTYYPEYYVVGGEELILRYTGLNAVRIQQLTWRDLGTSPINTFTESELLAYTNCPSSQEDGFTGEVTITLDKRCRRIAFIWGNTQDVRITPSQVLESITEVVLPVPDTAQVDFSKLSIDRSALKLSDYIDRIAQAKYVAGGSTNVTQQSLGLLHYSDIHGDDIAVDTIKNVMTEATDYIDDILCTGDSVQYYADDNAADNDGRGIEWWKNTGLAEKSLFVLGNHDAATTSATEYDTKEDSGAWNGKGQVWSFNNYFEDYAAGLGIIRPSDNDDTDHPACYWHKDYVSQKIRLIGLDCMNRFDGTCDPETGDILTAGFKHLTNEQELWLIDKLNETLNPSNTVYGWSVVFACHYPLDYFDGDNEEWEDGAKKPTYNQKSDGGRVMSYKTGAPVNFHLETVVSYAHTASNTNWHKFNMNNRVANSSGIGGYNPGTYNNVAEIIKAWMNRGGKYVVWLCGHTHADYMWYAENFPNMLCIVIDQAGCRRGTNVGARPQSLSSRVCANYISIDTQNGLIKIVRVGFTMNKFMNSHQYMCYDYINRKVLNEG